jgi:nucleoside phosphorylase
MPADIAITDPCVVFALRRESMYVRRAYPYQQRFPGAPCRAEFRGAAGQSVLMLETGIGAAAMETALHWCLSEPRFGDVPYRPRLVALLGFSGALQAELRLGDLVLANEIVDESGGRWSAFHPPLINTSKIALGNLFTAAELIGDPAEKQRLGRQYEALAVDMESAVAARLCHERAIPFVCLRVVSDDWNTPLSPQLLDLMRRGRVSPFRLAAAVPRHPRLLGELWRLAGQTRQAARKLLAIGALLSALDR